MTRVVGAIAAVAARIGLEGPAVESAIENLVMLASAYLVGQGIADHGKERVRMEQAVVLSEKLDA